MYARKAAKKEGRKYAKKSKDLRNNGSKRLEKRACKKSRKELGNCGCKKVSRN